MTAAVGFGLVGCAQRHLKRGDRHIDEIIAERFL